MTATQQQDRHGSSGNGSEADRPTAALAGITGVYLACLGVGTWLARDHLPERVSPWDLALVGVATHKLSRRLSKDSVTSPLREPFARVVGHAGPGEVQEVPQGRGLRKAIGELVTCPFCLGQWVATGFTLGLVRAPRLTRFVATVFTTAAIGDFLQFAYAKADQSSK